MMNPIQMTRTLSPAHLDAPPAEGELVEGAQESLDGHREFFLGLDGGRLLNLVATVSRSKWWAFSSPDETDLHALRCALEGFLPARLQTPADPAAEIPATAELGDVSAALDRLNGSLAGKVNGHATRWDAATGDASPAPDGASVVLAETTVHEFGDLRATVTVRWDEDASYPGDLSPRWVPSREFPTDYLRLRLAAEMVKAAS